MTSFLWLEKDFNCYLFYVHITVAKCFSRAAANGLEDQVRVGISSGVETGQKDVIAM